MSASPARGGCLCGAVRFRVDGPLRDVITCHCGECRRFHGAPGPYTSCDADALALEQAEPLRWIRSPASTTSAERAFCAECGSSLFWRAPGRPTVSIAAGAIDEPSGLVAVQHIWWEAHADWEVPDDLPRAARGL